MVPVTFTPAQAAVLTGLPLTAVNKAIDSGVLQARPNQGGAAVRRLSKEQVVFLQLEADGLHLVPIQNRREIAQLLERSPELDRLPVASGGALTLEVKPSRRRVEMRIKQLAKAQNMVVSDPEILGGTPVFRRTRIPVGLVAAMVAQGALVEEILAGYPALDQEKIALASLYVSAFPRRGRPRRLEDQLKRKSTQSFRLADLLKPA